MGHKAVKTRQEHKTKEQAQNVLEDDYEQLSAGILRFTFFLFRQDWNVDILS